MYSWFSPDFEGETKATVKSRIFVDSLKDYYTGQ